MDEKRQDPDPEFIQQACDEWLDRAPIPISLVHELLKSDQDPFTVAVRGHLIIDHLLTEAIRRVAPGASVKEIHRMAFMLKAEVVLNSRGMIGSFHSLVMIKGSLSVLNRIRNRMIHNWDYEYSDLDAQSLIDSVPRELHCIEIQNGHPPLNLNSRDRLNVLQTVVRTIWALLTYQLNKSDVEIAKIQLAQHKMAEALLPFEDIMKATPETDEAKGERDLESQAQFAVIWDKVKNRQEQ